jgi:hypothetical protein
LGTVGIRVSAGHCLRDRRSPAEECDHQAKRYQSAGIVRQVLKKGMFLCG